MIPILAIVIDDSIVNWIFGISAAASPVIGGGIWWLWTRFIAWIKPLIEGVFTEHTGLVVDMRKEVPKVSESLQRLCETQSKQCETLDSHGVMLAGHREKLDLLLKRHESESHS